TIAGGDATSLELTTAWNVNAAYEHFWNPRWRTSVYGGYAAVTYNSLANGILCANENNGTGGFRAFSVARVGCDNNWQTWWVGSRTQWNVTKDFYMGVDVLYSKLQTATQFANGTVSAPIAFSSATVAGDVDNWAVRFRVHRDFYP